MWKLQHTHKKTKLDAPDMSDQSLQSDPGENQEGPEKTLQFSTTKNQHKLSMCTYSELVLIANIQTILTISS